MFNLIKRLKPGTATALSTSALKVLDYDNNRGRAVIQNLDAAIVVTLGLTSGITAGSTSGIVLAAGETFVYYGTQPLYAIAASGTPNLGIVQETTVSNDAKKMVATATALSTTRAKIIKKDNKRSFVTVANAHASIAIWVGDSAVAANAGVKLAAGQKVTFHGVDDIYAVAASGTPTVTTWEAKRSLAESSRILNETPVLQQYGGSSSAGIHMVRKGIECPVDKAHISDAECLACRRSPVPRSFRHCHFSAEMLTGMMDGSGRASAHISATMLTSSCQRQIRLLETEDWYLNPETGFPAFRGTMGHAITEMYPQPGCVYEQRFEVPLLLPNGKTIKITGQIDKLDLHMMHIEDGKTKADKKINRITEAEDAHKWQLNIYRWLVYFGYPQHAISTDGLGQPLPGGIVLTPGKPAQLDITSLRLVYWSMEKPKMVDPPLFDMESIERYIIDRALPLADAGLPEIPVDLDPLHSPLCVGWCRVREACIRNALGF